MGKVIKAIRAWLRPPKAVTQEEFDAAVISVGKRICDAMDEANLPRICSYELDCNCRACTVFRFATRN